MHAKKISKNAGFTLLELMITITIIGILSVMAVPSYQDYQQRSKLGSALASMDGVKIRVAQCLMVRAKADCDSGAHRIPIVSDIAGLPFVESGSVTDGVITFSSVALNDAEAAMGIVMTPTSQAGSIVWEFSGNGCDSNNPRGIACSF